jgi:hypothetical protein
MRIVSIAVVVLVVACSGPKQQQEPVEQKAGTSSASPQQQVASASPVGGAETLDRSMAERLIREAGHLPGKALKFGFFSPAFIDSAPGRWPSLQRATDATRWRVNFVDKLVEAGILVWHDPRTYPVGNGGLYGTKTDRPFSAVPSEFVTESNNYITLTLAVPELKQVTGVSLDTGGLTAIAEAEIGLKATSLNERLLPIVLELFPSCATMNPQPDECQNWPRSDQLAQTSIQRFIFRKYDDGWRLEMR